ncbi:GNAT family N-acetyltransferase [Streptosporangium canum]|uniref:GNAT family N-acetyltransferase n=1 Tax=Streptosporangium canum TaxID=324952 RepID=UPI0037A96423
MPRATKHPLPCRCVARMLGLDRVLIVCGVDNLASAKTIERHGGVLEDVRDAGHSTVQRYWIKIGEPRV